MNDKTPDWLTEINPEEFAARIAERSARRAAVNWDMWPNLPKARLWQLVALSLGMEPSAVFPTEHATESAIALEGKDFRDRLHVAVANLAGQYEDDRGALPDSGALVVLQGDSYGRANAWISTNDFRAWAAAIGWTMPPQFAPQTGKVDNVLSPAVADEALTTSGRMSRENDQGRASSCPDANQGVRLEIGWNSRESVTAHIEERSRQLYRDEKWLTKERIATTIATELKDKGYQGARGEYLTAATIVRLMPPGLTGGRAKNRGKPSAK